MELAALLRFAGVAAVLIAVPGPDWAFILAAGARDRLGRHSPDSPPASRARP
jgi:threonine/homoserine/homoserine lactone efflux protein